MSSGSVECRLSSSEGVALYFILYGGIGLIVLSSSVRHLPVYSYLCACPIFVRSLAHGNGQEQAGNRALVSAKCVSLFTINYDLRARRHTARPSLELELELSLSGAAVALLPDTSQPTNSFSGGAFFVWPPLFRPPGSVWRPLFRRREAAPRQKFCLCCRKMGPFGSTL